MFRPVSNAVFKVARKTTLPKLQPTLRSTSSIAFFSTANPTHPPSSSNPRAHSSSQARSRMATPTTAQVAEKVSLPFDQAIARDHREIEQTYSQYKQATINDKQKWANELIKLISIHSVAEEMSVYPIEEREMGKQVAEHLRSEHQEVKEMLYQLEKMSVTDANYDAKLTTVIDNLLHHVKQEEKTYLPQLIAKLSREEIESISSRYQTSKAMAPTRPHPSASDKGGVMEGMAGMMAKPIDAMMDSAKDFPNKGMSSGSSNIRETK